jgi:hypothetical protein
LRGGRPPVTAALLEFDMIAVRKYGGGGMRNEGSAWWYQSYLVTE